jgi:hypothetical protein
MEFKCKCLGFSLNVDYILGNNPIPFVFKKMILKIDVLDIVGTVDIILTSTAGKIRFQEKSNLLS